ncbi:hypothetical protein EVAR_12770_1 [Eumeta japonica]|uniref:Uncharacterized protein n=1 Tax=Eumeta variegata TaxID=151549 RepID=A0A4C1UBH5_EUMVA|nr:hypothetical protein EVAR_12770_1 [Eumeta japonica]
MGIPRGAGEGRELPSLEIPVIKLPYRGGKAARYDNGDDPSISRAGHRSDGSAPSPATRLSLSHNFIGLIVVIEDCRKSVYLRSRFAPTPRAHCTMRMLGEGADMGFECYDNGWALAPPEYAAPPDDDYRYNYT